MLKEAKWLMVDMGFPRSRAEGTFRRVETNSIELPMEWLSSHPKEPAQEDNELAQALVLSLGNLEAPKDRASENGRDLSYEEKPLENPPIEDILTTRMNLLQSTYVITFSMIDLIVTLCIQNKGQYYLRVVSFLIQ